MTEPDVLLCNILTHELEIDADRVVVYDENFDPPKDDLLYIVVSTRKGKPLSVINDFDSDTNEEVSTVVSYDNRDAIERKEEVLMALTSMYSIEQQILNSVKIFRNGDILDLSFIETASALKRFRIPVIIANVKEKRKAAAYFDKFRTQGAIQE
jgi:hypothetical protein